MDFERIHKTAEWLGRDTDAIKVNKLKELSEQQRFYVTVWGHYSSGKSRLINNILCRDILPVQTRETTAALTYLQYGTREECVLVYEDGSVASYELGILKSVFQNTEKFEGVNKIAHIEVWLNHEFLKNGLILVDCPGANTIIRKHQELAANAIEQSGRILYVLGNPPSNVDRQFIKQIAACGIKINFIRTKCDRFMDAEENAQSSLQKEQNDIASFVGNDVEYIPVSNEPDSRWFANIEKVRSLLTDMSFMIAEEMKGAFEERLVVYCKQYIEELRAEEARLTQVIEGDTERISVEIDTCENERRQLEELAHDMEKQVEDKIEQAKKSAKRDLDDLVTVQAEAFGRALGEMKPEMEPSEGVKQMYAYHISDSAEKIQKLLNAHFDEIVKEETENITSLVPDGSPGIPAPAYVEVQQENSYILEMYRSRLQETKQRIEGIMRERQEMGMHREELEAGFDEASYEDALAILKQELSQIPAGTAMRLVEDQKIRPSSVLKAVGQMADLALLLMPGDMVFNGIKAAANTKKVAQTIHKMGKAGEVITKVGKAVGENAKAIDRVRDTVYALNNLRKSRPYSTKADKKKAEALIDNAAGKAEGVFETYKDYMQQSGNVLDALSVAYWTEKLGSQFDKPPRMEIDREEQMRRTHMRREVMLEQQKLSEERIQKKRELGLLQNKEAELRILEQEEEEKKRRMEEELRRQEGVVLKQARERAFANYKRDYENYYREAVCRMADMISKQYFGTANQNIVMYAARQNSEIMDRIEQKKEQICNLLEMKENGNETIAQRLFECRNLLDELEMDGQCG